MSYPCARCNFVAEDDDAAEEHARETSHLRCIVCQRTSLTVHERQTCARCVAAVRADLADILESYTLIEPSGVVGLTLLGDGTMQRHAHRYELDSLNVHRHPLAQPGEGEPRPIRDEWQSDPLPVLPALASWEDYLRQDYGDPKGAVPATLSATIDYLMSNLDTRHDFAQTFPGFDDLAAEIRRHRSTAHHAAGLADDPLEAEAECFDCGEPLLRTYAPPIGPVGGEPRRGLTGEGLTDEWTCSWCRHVYDQQSYFIGLRVATSMWVDLPLAAKVAHRSVWTVRSWARRLQVTAACRVSDGAVLVWWPDVSDRAFRHADEQRSA